MSFPLASITVYNSVVFGFFSNAQRFISKYRYGDERRPCSMGDLTVASALTGLTSVGLGAPVDLVKIRLQMQTQTILAGEAPRQPQAQHEPSGLLCPCRERPPGREHGPRRRLPAQLGADGRSEALPRPPALHQQRRADGGPAGAVPGRGGHGSQGRAWICALLHPLHHLLQPAETRRRVKPSPRFHLAGRGTGR